jgi:hypothetical protein
MGKKKIPWCATSQRDRRDRGARACSGVKEMTGRSMSGSASILFGFA